MDILTLKIRGDLRKHGETWRARWMSRWRMLQLIVLASGMLITIYSIFPQRWPAHEAAPLLLFAPVLLIAGLQPFIQISHRPRLLSILLAIVYLILAVLAAVLDPSAPESRATLPDWTNWLSFLIPLISWIILGWLFAQNPSQARRYSLRGHPVANNLVIGIGCGIGLALHLYLVAHFISAIEFSPFLFSRQGIFWMLCVLGGLLVPAEELIMRGEAFSILFDELNMRFFDTAMRITALDLLVYLVILVNTEAVLPFALLILVYRAGLSILSLYLVLRRRSLLPAMLANLVFSMATGWLFLL